MYNSSEAGCNSAYDEDAECSIVTISFWCSSQLSENDTKQPHVAAMFAGCLSACETRNTGGDITECC